jgi:hypothetical protein
MPEVHAQLFHYTMSARRMRSWDRCCVRSGGSPSYLLDVSDCYTMISFPHTLQCRKLPASLSVALTHPYPSAHSRPVQRSPRHTVRGMLDSVVRHSLPGMVWNGRTLAGSRTWMGRIGGFAHFLRRIEGFARSRIAPFFNPKMREVCDQRRVPKCNDLALGISWSWSLAGM